MMCGVRSRTAAAPNARAVVLALVVPLFVYHLVLAPRARAQEDTPPEGYRALVDAAIEESGEGRWAEARALFRQAHAMHPNARTLRGIGMASYELRDYTEAVRSLSAALDDTRTPLTADQRTQVGDLLARARAFVAHYEVELPEGATLSVDGHPASYETDGTLMLALGSHALAARGAAGASVEASVEVRGGETGPLPLDLTRIAVADRAADDDARDLEPPDTTPRTTRVEHTNVAPWVLVGIGGAAAVAGAVCLGVGMADQSALESAMPGTPWSSVRDAYERVPVLEGVGGVLLGVGLGAAAAGVVWAVASPTTSEEITVTLGPSGIDVRGTF